jgi:hypothetical protein
LRIYVAWIDGRKHCMYLSARLQTAACRAWTRQCARRLALAHVRAMMIHARERTMSRAYESCKHERTHADSHTQTRTHAHRHRHALSKVARFARGHLQMSLPGVLRILFHAVTCPHACRPSTKDGGMDSACVTCRMLKLARTHVDNYARCT